MTKNQFLALKPGDSVKANKHCVSWLQDKIFIVKRIEKGRFLITTSYNCLLAEQIEKVKI